MSEKLCVIFSVHGLRQKIVTDNGSSFTSTGFSHLMDRNGIHHVSLAPYHPLSNGLVERAFQTFKIAIKQMCDLPVQESLSKFLLKYHLTPHSTTGIVPAELLMGVLTHSLLDNSCPNLSLRVGNRQARQKLSHNNSKPIHTFTVGEVVFAKNFTGKSPKWLPGSMAEVTGPLSYIIQLQDGTTRRRHVDNIRNRVTSSDLPLIKDTPVSITNPLNAPASEPFPLIRSLMHCLALYKGLQDQACPHYVY